MSLAHDVVVEYTEVARSSTGMKRSRVVGVGACKPTVVGNVRGTVMYVFRVDHASADA